MRLLEGASGGLWEVVNELARFRDSTRESLRVTIFGSARVLARSASACALGESRVDEGAVWLLLGHLDRERVVPIRAVQGEGRGFSVISNRFATVPDLASLLLVSFTTPPWPRTIPSSAARPSPRPEGRVLKNGSKTRLCVSASMPGPSSAAFTIEGDSGFDYVNPVPEPGRAILMRVGAVCLAALGRRS